MDIVVIGTGVYVSGRGTSGFGTVLPAILEYQRTVGNVRKVHLVGTKQSHAADARVKAARLIKDTGVKAELAIYPIDQEDNEIIYKDVLRHVSRPACAIVVVPDHLHHEIARECLNSSLHTLVVKPLTTTVSEAKDLIRICGDKNLYGAVEFHKRFDRHNLKLKEIISNGKIGQLLYFTVKYSQKKHVPIEYFSSWVDRTNIFQYLGVHYVDVIYFVTRAKPKRVLVLAQSGWLRDRNSDAFDIIHATIEWEMPAGNRFLSFIHTGWIDPESSTAESDQRIEVVGTEGRLESNQKRRGMEIVSDEDGVEDINPDFCSPYKNHDGLVSYKGYGIDSITTFLRDIADLSSGEIDMNQLENCRPTFQSSLCSVAVIEAINSGLHMQGAWIDIDF